jgi:hypothetical protein
MSEDMVDINPLDISAALELMGQDEESQRELSEKYEFSTKRSSALRANEI